MSVMYWYVFESMLPPSDGGSFEALPIHRGTMTARATHTAMPHTSGEMSLAIISQSHSRFPSIRAISLFLPYVSERLVQLRRSFGVISIKAGPVGTDIIPPTIVSNSSGWRRHK